MLNKILKNKVFKNFSYLTIGNVLSQLISLFTILKITHVLAPEDYGLFSFLVVQGLLLVSIANLGIKNIVVRSIARDHSRAKDLVINGAILKFCSVFFLSLLYIIYNNFLGNLTFKELFLIFGFTLAKCLFDLFQDAFYGREKMLVPSLINLGYSILWFLSVYYILPGYFSVTYLFFIYLSLNILKAAIAFFFIKKQHLLIGSKGKFLTSSKNLFKESWPYFALILIMLPLTKLSSNFLDINSTIDQVGYFNLGEKITGPISMVIDLALVSIFPNLSSLWIKDKSKFYKYISIGFKYFMLGALLLCFLFTLFAKEIITLLFPVSYLPAVKVSQLQIWYLFLAAVDSLIGTVLGAINKEKLILKFAIIKALFCTPLLYISSKYGAIGLSYGFVISVAIFQIYLWIMFLKVMKVKIKHADFLWAISLFLFIISYFLQPEFNLLYKSMLSIIAISGTAYYLFKMYKTRILV